MNKFYHYIAFMVATCATLFISSCSDDDDELYPKMTLSQQSVYFSQLDQSQTITYSGSNISKVKVSDVPEGWSVSIKHSSKKIYIAGPTEQADFDTSIEPSTITFTATSPDDNTSYKYLTVGTTTNTADISDQQANCFIVSDANTIYHFDALSKSEGEESISPKSVSILWQSSPTPLSFSRLVDGQVEFHLALDEDDFDGDLLFDDIIEGNAVIAAYNSKGAIIWSWHIWVTEFDPESTAVEINGTTIMNRNLGALNNSVLDQSDILDSYGMFYQWGRKDPFIGAYYYNAAQGTDAPMYKESGNSTTITYAASSSTKGTMAYAVAHPTTFVLGVEKSSNDWIYNAHSDDLWADQKTINDPCPKGWRVASASTLENLSIPSYTEQEGDAIAEDYGWYMTDDMGNGDLFMGLGRRGYITGKIQNVNLNLTRPTPWAGYYWTTSAGDNSLSSALFFAFDQADLSGSYSEVENHYRANGMQVRCQKVE